MSERDYLSGRSHLPIRELSCPTCGKSFTAYLLSITECRVCKARPRDFLCNLIEVGDRFYVGNPPAFGRVIKVRGTSILLEIGAVRGVNCTQGVKSPDQGLCVDKVPDDF